ncbi:unnamed protein product, partial [Iphiclides podalirius]
MDRVWFKVNGVECTVGCEVSSDTTLLDYIRSTLKLSGTKYMCQEAGCGACIVSVVKCTGAPNTSVNATTLADNHGTQCGYCSPGWVMAMNRSILHAFKKFAQDAPSWSKIHDIEDLHICKRSGEECSKSVCEDYDWCVVSKDDVEVQPVIHIKLEDGREWFRVRYLLQAFNILHIKGDDSYMLVAGNTAKGAYPIFQYPRILIDISAVSELKSVVLDQNLVIGAGSTISEVMEIFQTESKLEYFEYLEQLYQHLTLVAHIPVRNVMPRAQNAHAIVNAGFMYKLQNGVVHEARIVYGGLSPVFIRATNTENYLKGKALFTNDTLQTALHVLDSELIVTENPPEASVAYRRQLALSLFYKGLLTLCPPNILHPRYRSGAIKLKETRPVSDGRQIFDTNPSLWPLNQPVRKVEGLREPGVIAFYTAKDIPGTNSYTPSGSLLSPNNEELLCNGRVKYYNQPIAIIVAKTRQIADRAAKLVTVKYKNVKKPLLDIKEAKNDANRNTMFANVPQTERGDDIQKVIKGSNTIYGQYHFCMETLVCVTRPTEEGMEIHPATQWMDGVQICTSRALNIPENKIDVHVRRIGGAYGYKITRSLQVAVACSLVVQKLNRPCRFIQSLTTNMRAVGKRLPCSTNFEELIKRAFEANVDLQTHAFVSAADVQNYDIFGVTVAEVEVDILTGQTEVIRIDLLEDVGRSVSPEIDIGQVEGAFVMGLGYWTSENLVYDTNSGELLTNRTWDYWVPQARDIPQDFRIYFRKKSYSTDAILGSKATGEPATCMAIVVPFAIREAISSARLESGIPSTQWFEIGESAMPDKVASFNVNVVDLQVHQRPKI